MTDDDRRGRVRIGHAERERAVQALSGHFAEGRLDAQEFDLRVTAAYSAVYTDELRELFSDLPGFGDDIVDERPIAPTRPWGPVPAYRADTRWAPPPSSHTRYEPPATGPTPTPAVMGVVFAVTIVVVVAILVVATRGIAILPLIFIGLPFFLGGRSGRRRRPPT